MKWKNKFGWLLGAAALFGLLVTPTFADSERFIPEPGYAAQDKDMAAPYNIGYSAGLDVVYANISTAEQPTRAFVHAQINTAQTTMDVQLFKYNGERSTTIYSHSGTCWPQVTKKIGDKIWFSYTGGAGDGYYSVPWDETLGSYPATTATAEVISDYNWEVEEDPDGRIFVCGATSMAGGQSIVYVDTNNSNNLITVINVGGNSSGFAFDSAGNIWSGEYLLANAGPPYYQMYILPCRLGMWSKADVDIAITNGIPLDWDDAVKIPFGTTDITGETTNWGPNDIEADGEGNIYVSMNTYDNWGYQYTYGSAVKLSPDGSGGYTMNSLGVTIQRTGDEEWDWARSLAYDGNADLDSGGYTDPTQGGPTANILFLDMDMGTFHDDVDHVVGITIDADYDNDGVPDGLDNAPESANAGQQDTDWDSYGNIVDADFNNDDTVNYNDLISFQTSWGSSEGDPAWNPNTDMNSDENINYNDFINFQGHWGVSAPYF